MVRVNAAGFVQLVRVAVLCAHVSLSKRAFHHALIDKCGELDALETHSCASIASRVQLTLSAVFDIASAW